MTDVAIKKEIKFSNVLYFGRGFDGLIQVRSEMKKQIRCTLMNMLLKGVLNMDGTMDIKYYQRSTKKEVWMYIFYLWRINLANFPLFRSMGVAKHFKSGNIDLVPNAELFVKAVLDTLRDKNMAISAPTFSVIDLMEFVNIIVKIPLMQITILEVLQSKLISIVANKEEGLQKGISILDQRIDSARKELDGIKFTGVLQDNTSRSYSLTPGEIQINAAKRNANVNARKPLVASVNLKLT